MSAANGHAQSTPESIPSPGMLASGCGESLTWQLASTVDATSRPKGAGPMNAAFTLRERKLAIAAGFVGALTVRDC